MFKKYLPIVLFPLITACSWGGTPVDFIGMYQSQIGAQVDSVHELAQDLGFGKQYTIDGSMKFDASVPGYASGILSADYTSKVDGRDLEFSAHNLLLGYEAFIASGSVSLDTFNITSKAGDTYFLMKDLKEHNMLSPLMNGVFQKYNNTWLALTRADVEKSLSGSTVKNMLSYKFSEELSSLTSDELKNLLVKYPVFQQTQDLGMSGSFHAYAVMLNAPNIVSLVDALSTRLTGSGLALDERESFSKELSSLASSGMVLYDPKNPKYVSLSINLVAKEGGEVQIILHEDKDHFSLSISSGVSAFSFSSDRTEKGDSNISISIIKEGKQVAKMIATVKHDGERFSELDLTIASPAQGVTLTLTHKNAKDGSFEGNMNFGLGNATWTGNVVHSALASLHLHGAAVGTTLGLDLNTKDGDMTAGPLILRSGDTEVFMADLGLRATPERFSLTVDTALPTDNSTSNSGSSVPKAHFDADIIAKRSGFSGKISAPTQTKPFKEFIDALDAIAPTESFQEDVAPTKNEPSDSAFTGSISQ